MCSFKEMKYRTIQYCSVQVHDPEPLKHDRLQEEKKSPERVRVNFRQVHNTFCIWDRVCLSVSQRTVPGVLTPEAKHQRTPVRSLKDAG